VNRSDLITLKGLTEKCRVTFPSHLVSYSLQWRCSCFLPVCLQHFQIRVCRHEGYVIRLTGHSEYIPISGQVPAV